jgi:carboxypeptidase PM20D1
MTRRLIAASLAGCLLVLVLAVVVRTKFLTSRQLPPEAAELATVDERPAAERLATALRIRTISWQPGPPREPAAFRAFADFLRHTYPRTFARLAVETVGTHSLLLKWTGSQPEGKPVLLMAHMDVVPAEPSSLSQWTHPPFDGVIADGYVWGRGAMDDKSSLLGMLEAVEGLIARGFQPTRTIYLALGHDEEVGGRGGNEAIARHLKAQGVRLDTVLDEGQVVAKDILTLVTKPVAMIGVAEKGFVNVELTVAGSGGHSSMPPPQTALGVLAAAIQHLEANQSPIRWTGTVGATFDYLAPEMTGVYRLAFANRWLFEPLITRRFTEMPTTNALLRTTTAVTMAEGSVKENILPMRARAVANFRILPGESIASTLAHVRSVIADDRVEVRALPGFSTEPAPESSMTGEGFQVLHRTLRQVFPKALVAPTLVVPATDSRYYTPIADNVYRFLPIEADNADIKRLHGVNERIGVGAYARMIQFYDRFLRNAAG